MSGQLKNKQNKNSGMTVLNRETHRQCFVNWQPTTKAPIKSVKDDD